MKRFTLGFAETLKALGGEGDGKRRLHGIASSTVKDRHGDVITREALQKMERQAVGMTIFFNHDYTVPESVAGTVEKAEVRQHPSDPDIVDLVYDIVLNEANPRAVNSWESMHQGTRLGLSIGARIPKDGATKNAEGAYIINDIELLETSIVGVPASPRSFVDYAVKSLRSEAVTKATAIGATPVDVEEESDETPAEPDDVVAQAEPVELEASDAPEATGVTVEEFVSGGTDTRDAADDEEAEPEHEPAYQDVDTPEVVEASDEPDTPQDAPESTPENGDLLQSEETEVTIKALLSSADSLTAAHEIIAGLSRELVQTKALVRDAEEERDKVVSLTRKTMDDTSSLLERLASTPKGRQTNPVVIETQTRFDTLKSVYTDGVMSLLTKERN